MPRKDLVKVSEVNKMFRDLSRDYSLWTRLTLDYEDINQKKSIEFLLVRYKISSNQLELFTAL